MEGAANKKDDLANESHEDMLTSTHQGPVTDYGATVLHWMHDRLPAYRGYYSGEAERPSASYIIDVSVVGSHYHLLSLTASLDAAAECPCPIPC